MNASTRSRPSASPRVAAFDKAMGEATQRYRTGDLGTAFVLLERAHVLGQPDFVLHMRVHLAMLRVAWALSDWREVRGQVLRLCLVPLGHLIGRLPRGNTGASNVSAFAPMAVSSELEQLLSDKET